jgi:hypothetical protein
MNGARISIFSVLKADDSTAKLEAYAALCYGEISHPAASYATRGGGSLPTWIRWFSTNSPIASGRQGSKYRSATSFSAILTDSRERLQIKLY